MTRHLRAVETPPVRAVVLGSTGFIGQALCREWKRCGIPTLELGSSALDLSMPDAGQRLASCLSPGDCLVFTSAITRDRGRDSATMMRNLAMAEAVVQAIRRQPCAHLVYLSSDAVYGDSAPSPVTERAPCCPTDLYGVMHFARERMLSVAAAEQRVPLFILRPTIVFGPGDTHGTYGPNRFIRSIRDEQRIELFGRGEEFRDHIHVQDLVGVIVDAACRLTEGQLNVASGQPVRFSEVAAIMCRLAGEPITIEYAPRTRPITHQWFDIAALLAAFPHFRPRSLEVALGDLLGADVQASQPEGR